MLLSQRLEGAPLPHLKLAGRLLVAAKIPVVHCLVTTPLAAVLIVAQLQPGAVSELPP